MIEPGAEALVRPGTTVRLAQVMTLRFLGSEQGHSARDAATLQQAAEPHNDTITVQDAGESLDDIGVPGGADRARAPVA